MKTLVVVLLIACCTLRLAAQSANPLDREKLLDLYQSQQFTAAAAYLQSVYHEDTREPKELSQLAYANMMAGNLVLAEKEYLTLYNLQPGSLPILFNLASISRRRGDDAHAKSYYLEIIKKDSLNFNVYKQLAAMIDVPTAPEKIGYLKKANALNPQHPDVAFDLANGLNLSKKNDSAYLVLQPALMADSANLILLKAKLPVCIALKKIDEALQTGQRLMAAGDSSSYVLNQMGKAYFVTKQFDKALNLFLTIEHLDQQNETTLYYTARCYRELQHYPLAADYMKKSIKEGISPAVSVYYKVLGEIYEKNNQLSDARQSYQKSLDFENNGEVYYNLALLNEFKLSNTKAAVRYYRRFLQSKPDPEKYGEVIIYVKERLAALRR